MGVAPGNPLHLHPLKPSNLAQQKTFLFQKIHKKIAEYPQVHVKANVVCRKCATIKGEPRIFIVHVLDDKSLFPG